MATRVELPKEITKSALEQAAGLRMRQAKAASNEIVKQALQQEENAIRGALSTMTEIK